MVNMKFLDLITSVSGRVLQNAEEFSHGNSAFTVGFIGFEDHLFELVVGHVFSEFVGHLFEVFE